MFALVSDEDYEQINKHTWHVRKKRHVYYALRYTKDRNGKIKKIWMHRQIIGTPICLEMDHINGNGLDNQRENLRVATTMQNSRNRHNSKRKSKTGYAGVESKGRGYKAYIHFNYKKYFLGYYYSPKTAFDAHVKASIELFGEFSPYFKRVA